MNTDELREVNGRLLIASLQAQDVLDVQTELRTRAEAALDLRDQCLLIAGHELRTTITGINLGAQLALRLLTTDEPDHDRIVGYLNAIAAGVTRLAVLTTDLVEGTSRSAGPVPLVARSHRGLRRGSQHV